MARQGVLNSLIAAALAVASISCGANPGRPEAHRGASSATTNPAAGPEWGGSVVVPKLQEGEPVPAEWQPIVAVIGEFYRGLEAGNASSGFEALFQHADERFALLSKQGRREVVEAHLDGFRLARRAKQEGGPEAETWSDVVLAGPLWRMEEEAAAALLEDITSGDSGRQMAGLEAAAMIAQWDQMYFSNDEGPSWRLPKPERLVSIELANHLDRIKAAQESATREGEPVLAASLRWLVRRLENLQAVAEGREPPHQIEEAPPHVWMG